MFGHKHRYVERKEDREETMTFIKFVFVCLECGDLKTKIVNPKQEFEIRI